MTILLKETFRLTSEVNFNSDALLVPANDAHELLAENVRCKLPLEKTCDD